MKNLYQLTSIAGTEDSGMIKNNRMMNKKKKGLFYPVILIFFLINLVVNTNLQAQEPFTLETEEPVYFGWDKTVDASIPYSVPLLPDINSSYSAFAWNGDPNQDNLAVEITGVFPRSRYMSYTVYDFSEGDTLVTMRDEDIEPDPGSFNPYRPNADRNLSDHFRRYTVWFAPGTEEEHDAIWDDEARYGRNIKYIGHGLAAPTIMLRIYKPDEGCGHLGCSDLPKIRLFREDGYGGLIPEKNRPPFDLSGSASGLMATMRERNLLREIEPTLNRDRIDFYRLSPAGLMPTADNGYIGAVLDMDLFHCAAVLKFKAPSYPDTGRGGESQNRFPGAHTRQVRYWSLNIGDILTTTTSSGLSDSETIIDAAGYVTVVVGPENSLLRRKVAEAGYNFLPLGLQIMPVLILRHLCHDESFTRTPNYVPIFDRERWENGELNPEECVATKSMGDYAPTGRYYSIIDLIETQCLLPKSVPK